MYVPWRGGKWTFLPLRFYLFKDSKLQSSQATDLLQVTDFFFLPQYLLFQIPRKGDLYRMVIDYLLIF